ncbi:transcription elongation factor Spt6 [Linnemannia elongata AG-77]|uniref:Transcription elongation factor Spt6 n=1 Tax=Linnemannia elongata AG-77 TaxID=1314771 RepID=A0A197KGE0_9FUNG|nr:transcription elongation factor Spt6 [Linnemannia elongata AG-77]
MSDDEDRRNYSDEEGEDVGFDDSDRDDDSEEDEEDDEEEMKRVRDGFIVDDDEDEEEEEDEEVVRRSKKKKRRKEAIEEDLDDEDLDLMEENTGVKIRRPEKFKRLKKRRQEDSDDDEESGTRHDALQKIFDDEDDEGMDDRGGYEDDMDRFIDDDEDEDEGLDDNRHNRREKAPVKPRARRAPIEGLSEEVWGEWYEVFGDGEDYAYALGKENGEDNYYDKKPEPRLKDVFEPGVLAERMMTDTDEIIRVKDVPERMQLRPGIQADRILTDDDVEDEAYWITSQLNENRRGVDQPAFQAENVNSVLKFMSIELMEVPFIEAHRRDYFTRVNGAELTSLLSREDLWYIYDLDLKYRSFLERREAIKALTEKMEIKDPYLNESLIKANKLEELTDVSDYINLRFSKQIDKTKAFKRPGAGGAYDTVKRQQLAGFIKDFGLSAREFGTNLIEGNKRFFPEDVIARSPTESAENLLKEGFPSADRVISMAMNMIAQELAVDPQVRRAIRAKYESAACVTVTPTEKGVTVIDELHPFYPFKRLAQKYVRDFHDGQYLQILQAQSEGLVKVEIKIPEEANYLQGVMDYFLSDNFSENSQKWNELRRKVLSTALKDSVFVLIERGMSEKLRTQAEEWVAKKCQTTLEDKLMMAPYVPRGARFDREYSARVVAISHGAGSSKDAIQVAFVDDKGKFMDHMKIDNLRDEKSQKDLIDFLDRRRPDVIVVGGFTVNTRRLVEQVEKVVGDLRELRGDDISVIMTNDEVARLYQHSKAAQEDHPEANPLTRYCISLARLIQNPMNEYAALGRDLINIRQHPLQHLVGEDRLRELLDRALINVINHVGIDFNAVVDSPYKAHMLKYICGLGPRKAQSLIKGIEADQHNGSLDKRGDLVIRKLLTWRIFMNCCSFLRVHTSYGGDVLDETRIHSEDYNLARKMAADALEIDEEALEEYENASQHVEELMRDDSAEKLNDLLLEDYAHQLELIQNKPKRMTLETIKHELQDPFRDPRRPFERASPDVIFTMLTGETPQTLKEGFIVPALVTKIRDRNAMCRLDCGIDGMLAIQNIADTKIGAVSDVLSEGQTLQVKILRLDREKYFADLTCKESELRHGDTQLRMLPVDRMFDQFEEERSRNEVKKSEKVSHFLRRKINHPLFKNMNGKEATEFLADKTRGELVIRPSNRGVDHLTVTVKLADDFYKHFDILEMDKKDDVSLGKILKIDNSKYTDLDELLVSHIEAIMAKTELIMANRKYKESASDLRQSLDTQTKAKPDACVYGFTLDRKFPGFFSLLFKLGASRPIEELSVKVLPDHYVLKGPTNKDCKDFVTLCNSFKELMQQRLRPKPVASTSTAGPSNSRPHYNSQSGSSNNYSSYNSSSGYNGSSYGSSHHTPSHPGSYHQQPSSHSHHYVPHHSQQPVVPHHLAHQAAPPMHQQGHPSSSSSSGHWGSTPWGGAPWTGAAGGGHMGPPSGHMTGPHHGYGSAHGDSRHGPPGGHDSYGARSSRAPPTPRRFMPPPGQQPQQPFY